LGVLALSAKTTPMGALKTFADLDTTPSVDGYGSFAVANSIATTITELDDLYDGQVVHILASNANTTFDNNAKMVTRTSADRVTVANTFYTFIAHGGVAYEVEDTIPPSTITNCSVDGA
jgi:hypothetical protein